MWKSIKKAPRKTEGVLGKITGGLRKQTAWDAQSLRCVRPPANLALRQGLSALRGDPAGRLNHPARVL